MLFPREHKYPNLPRDFKRRKLNVDVSAGASIMAALSRARFFKYDYGSEREDRHGADLVWKRTREMKASGEVERLVAAMQGFGEPTETRPRRKITASTAGLIRMAEKLFLAGMDYNCRHVMHCGEEKHVAGPAWNEECSGNVREEGYGNHYLYHQCLEYPVPGLIDIVLMKLKEKDIDRDFETVIGKKLVQLMLKEFLPLAWVSRHVQGDEPLGLVAGYLYPYLLSMDDFPVQDLRKKDLPAWELHSILNRVGSEKMATVTMYDCSIEDPCFGANHNGIAHCTHIATVMAKVTSTRLALLEQIDSEGISTLGFLHTTEQFYQQQLYYYREHLQSHANRLEKLKDKIGREIVKRM